MNRTRPNAYVGGPVEAVLLNYINAEDVAEWCDGSIVLSEDLRLPVAVMVDGARIATNEWVVRATNGKHYGIRQYIFDALYEPAVETKPAEPEDAAARMDPADLDTINARNVVSDLLCARIRAGMTVEDVADAMETSVRFVRRFEGDQRLSTIQRYAAAVGVDLMGPMVVGPVHEVVPGE